MNKIYKNCQSCGMPNMHDTHDDGTNKDGTRSYKYCKDCYRDGSFLFPELTVSQMKSRVKRKLKNVGYSTFLARFFSRGISSLERWKKEE